MHPIEQERRIHISYLQGKLGRDPTHSEIKAYLQNMWNREMEAAKDAKISSAKISSAKISSAKISSAKISSAKISSADFCKFINMLGRSSRIMSELLLAAQDVSVPLDPADIKTFRRHADEMLGTASLIGKALDAKEGEDQRG